MSLLQNLQAPDCILAQITNMAGQHEYLTDRPIKRLFRLLSLDRKEIMYIVLYSLFGGLIGLTIPLGVQAIINLIAIGQTSTSWVVLTVIIAFATAIIGTMKVMQLIIMEILQQRIFVRSAFEFAYRIPRFRSEGIRNQYAPELANRFFDTLSVQKGLPKLVTDLPDSALQILFGLVLLALYHPFFVAFGITLIILLSVVIFVSGPSGIKTSLKESKYKYKVAYWLEELGRTMNSFKLAGRTQYPLEVTDDLVESYLGNRNNHFNILRWQLISVVTLKTLATFSLLLIGGLLVINNEINIGQFVAAEIMIIVVMNSMEKIVVSMETVFEVLTAIEKIGTVTDLELESEEGLDFAEINKYAKGMDIKLANLSYRSKDSNELILKDISLDIKAGEKVGILGFNGAGKTTLLKILLGIYEDFEGSITYNGIPRKNINVASLRSFMGDYVSEEYLFHDTLAMNISMGREEVSLQDIMEICDRVALTEYIQTLPKGLDTEIPSDGESLPQNVVRKIILARAIVDNPKLLAIESMLNNFENRDKKRLIEALTDKNRSWTLVAVTRNSHLARRCDKLIVMRKGEIIFRGSYAELQIQPYFSNLFDDVFSC